jgi:hypothetical protein
MLPDDFEEWIAFVAAHLGPETSQDLGPDGALITGGEPPLVIVRLTPARLIVWEYAARREGHSGPAVTPIRIGSISWRRLPESIARTLIASLIDAARESRLAKFALCHLCSTRTPPEWMHDDEVCQGCAESHPRTVH